MSAFVSALNYFGQRSKSSFDSMWNSLEKIAFWRTTLVRTLFLLTMLFAVCRFAAYLLLVMHYGVENTDPRIYMGFFHVKTLYLPGPSVHWLLQVLFHMIALVGMMSTFQRLPAGGLKKNPRMNMTHLVQFWGFYILWILLLWWRF